MHSFTMDWTSGSLPPIATPSRVDIREALGWDDRMSGCRMPAITLALTSAPGADSVLQGSLQPKMLGESQQTQRLALARRSLELSCCQHFILIDDPLASSNHVTGVEAATQREHTRRMSFRRRGQSTKYGEQD